MSKGKISVTFSGFDTLEQAKAFLSWYSGSGEQDASIWLEENSDLMYANVDGSVPYTSTDSGIECSLRLTYKE